MSDFFNKFSKLEQKQLCNCFKLLLKKFNKEDNEVQETECDETSSQNDNNSSKDELVNNEDNTEKVCQIVLPVIRQEITDLKSLLDKKLAAIDEINNKLGAIDEIKDKFAAIAGVSDKLVAIDEINNKLEAINQQLADTEANNKKLEDEIEVVKGNTKQLLESAKAEKQELENKNNTLTKQLEGTEAEKQELENKNNTLTKQLEGTEAEKQELETTNENLTKQLEGIEAKKQKLETTNENLTKQLEGTEAEKQKLENKNNTLTKQLEGTEAEKQELENKNNTLTKQLEGTEAEKQELENKNNTLTKQLEGTEAEKQKLEAEVTDFYKNTEKFLPLLETIYQCESMKQYLIDKNIPEVFSKTSDCIIPFIAAAGTKYNFAWDMVSYMAKYKKDNREPMTENELAMMNAANQFYKEMYAQEEDILYIPQGLETISDCNTPFRKQDMQDIEKITGTFRIATEIYVPAFKEYQRQTCNTKAIVKGK